MTQLDLLQTPYALSVPKTSQTEAILAYLQTGAALTPLEALDRFGTFRLASRCWELRKAGWKIACDLVPVGKGKHVASYRLTNS